MDSTQHYSSNLSKRKNKSCRKNSEPRLEIKGTKKVANEAKRKNFTDIKRTVTDKNWCFLFLFIFIIWVVSGYYVRTVPRHDRPASTNEVDSSSVTKNATELDRYYLWGDSWLFDMITCNVAFLSKHYKNSGSIVILANICYCGLLIVYSVSSMRTDEIFYNQLKWIGGCFGMWTLYYRLIVSGKLCCEHRLPLYIPFHDKFEFFLMPEVIFIIILYAKSPQAVFDLKKVIGDGSLRFLMLLNYIICVGFLLLLSFAFLIQYTIVTLNELVEDDVVAYVIVGCSCYLALSIFYFGLMVASCITNITLTLDDSILQDDWKVLIKTPLRALIIVGSYHFGSACYHATLIFPRLETLFIMKEPDVKKFMGSLKLTERFYVTQWKFHNLSLVATALRGSNHSKSIRILSLAFFSYLPRLKYFQTFSQVAESLMGLLLSTNSLMLIYLWAYGADDPRLSLATWALYIYVMLAVSLCMQLHDVVLDTLMFYMDYALASREKNKRVFKNKSFI